MKEKPLFENVGENQFKLSELNYLKHFGADKLMNLTPDQPTGSDWQDLEEDIWIINGYLKDVYKLCIKTNTKKDLQRVDKITGAIIKLLQNEINRRKNPSD